jgi:hypothetical protein
LVTQVPRDPSMQRHEGRPVQKTLQTLATLLIQGSGGASAAAGASLDQRDESGFAVESGVTAGAAAVQSAPPVRKGAGAELAAA